MAAIPLSPTAELQGLALELQRLHGHQPADSLLRRAMGEWFPGRLALVSSFGAESAVLLHLVSRLDPGLPVVFIDTRKLFGETKRYRDLLAARLGLTDVRSVAPEEERLAERDPDGFLWARDPDLCCRLRKVEPLERALAGFDAWITGRKAYQGASRLGLPAIEADGRRIKINPLARWTQEDVQDYLEAHDLPRHPLEADGFLSIGCMPCTDRVAPDEDPRAGRWRGREKVECGIHLAPVGQTVATSSHKVEVVRAEDAL